jgi:hypothetical protein
MSQSFKKLWPIQEIQHKEIVEKYRINKRLYKILIIRTKWDYLVNI